MIPRIRPSRGWIALSCLLALFVLGACAAKVQNLGEDLEPGMTETQVRRTLIETGGPSHSFQFEFLGDTVQVLQYEGHPLHGAVYDVDFVLVNGRYVAGGAYENDFDRERVDNLRTYLARHNDENLKKLEKGMTANEVQAVLGHVPRPDVPQPAVTSGFNDGEGNSYRVYKYYTQDSLEPLTPIVFKNDRLVGVGRDSPAYQRHDAYLVE